MLVQNQPCHPFMKQWIELRSKLLNSKSKKQGIKKCGKLLTLHRIYNYIGFSLQQPIISILGKLVTFVLLSTSFLVLSSLFFIVVDILMTTLSIHIVRCWLVCVKHFKEWLWLQEQELQWINKLKSSREQSCFLEWTWQ